MLPERKGTERLTVAHGQSYPSWQHAHRHVNDLLFSMLPANVHARIGKITHHNMAMLGFRNWPSRGPQFAVEELVEGVEGFYWLCSVTCIQLSPKGPQKLVNFLQHPQQVNRTLSKIQSSL